MPIQIGFDVYLSAINIILIIEDLDKFIQLLYKRVNNSFFQPIDNLRLSISRVILGLNEECIEGMIKLNEDDFESDKLQILLPPKEMMNIIFQVIEKKWNN